MKAIILYITLNINFIQSARTADLSGRITDYTDYHLERNEDLARINESGNFMGRKTPGSGVIGWFGYDVEVDIPGWYEVLVEYDRNVFAGGWACHLTEYSVDGRYLYDYPYEVSPGVKKAGNIWLDKGRHTFRIENRNWFTRSPITGYEFKHLETNLAKNIRVDLDVADDYYGGCYYAVNEPLPVNVYSAGDARGRFSIDILREDDRSLVKTYDLLILPSETEKKQTIKISVGEEGSFVCRFKADGKEISKAEALRKIAFVTIDTTPVTIPESVEEVESALVFTIDCSERKPDYQNTESVVGAGEVGKYRETGNNDWDYYAYKLPVINSDAVYFVEIDIPDDKQRAIQIQFRERDPVNYIIGPGIETGFPYRNSGGLITRRYFFWPRMNGEQPRIAVVNVGNNDSSAPAAVKEIRLYRVTGQLPSLKRREQGREFFKWFEEPSRWLDPYGARDKSSGEAVRSADNWARTMRYLGETTMFLAVDVYGLGMYPSKYRYSSKYSGDQFKMILLVAEKYGLKVIADFSPKIGTLTTKFYNEPAPGRFDIFSYDKNGNHYDYTKDANTGFYNMVHPEVQNEIKSKMAEFAGRYKNCSALEGASIRVMNWQSHTMTYFKNLDWGYEPYTGKLFSSFLGISDPGTPQARYALFTGRYRDKWIEWRIKKVHDLLKGIVDTCRSVVPGFNIYANVHSSVWAGEEAGREAGIDNFKIDGFAYINGFYGTGRKRGAWQKTRALAADTAVLNQFSASRAHFFGFQYFEDGGKYVPGPDLGLKEQGRKWISAHLNPAGDYMLQRYALALAETDAIFMGNGGNTYCIDPTVIREFLADYIVLPKDRFATVLDDPRVVVRELKKDDVYIFYLVNRTEQPRRIALSFGNAGTITRISTGQTMVPDSNRRIIIALEPFRVYSFQTSRGGILSARVEPR